jgi:hypothetical protein
MLDGTRKFPNPLRWSVKQVHLIVLLSNLVGNAACPRLDLVEPELFFIVARLAHVYLFVPWEPTRSAAAKTGDEHDKATIQDVLDLVIPILTGFHHLMVEEMLVEAMHCLLRPVIPTRVDPTLAVSILPGPIYLSNNRLGEIIWVADMNPIPWD